MMNFGVPSDVFILHCPHCLSSKDLHRQYVLRLKHFDEKAARLTDCKVAQIRRSDDTLM